MSAANPFDTAAEVRRLAAQVAATPLTSPRASDALLRYADLIERVEQLPRPISVDVPNGCDSISDWENVCGWCGVRWDYEIGRKGKGQRHPQNGCLALMLRPAAPTDAGEERT